MYVLKKLCSLLNIQRKPSKRSAKWLCVSFGVERPMHPNGSERAEVQSSLRASDQVEVKNDHDKDVGFNISSIPDINKSQMPFVSADQIEYQGGVPSIYIDTNLLEEFFVTSLHREGRSNSFVYEIDGSSFPDDITNTNDLLEFEIIDHYSEQNNDDIFIAVEANKDAVLSNPIEKKLNTDVSVLPTTVQKTPYGLVINSCILISENGWNTILCGDRTMCVACNRNLDIREISDHIVTDSHKNILNKYKPLKKFDVNIVRQFNDKYHCAICNITFDNEDIEHVESLSHGQKFLNSINKVSDIIDVNEYDIRCNESRNDGNDCTNLNAIVEDSSGFDSESFDSFYDDVSVSYCNDSDTEEKECNEISDQNLFSYADILKKPKTFTASKYVQIKLGHKFVKITFDSWHMVITLKNNRFYCMACKENGPIRFKNEHCLNVNHVEKLMKCGIVSDYKEHVVRKVDARLYHCGHCNNLQMIHEVRHHIETTHTKRNVAVNTNVSEKATMVSPKMTVVRSTMSSPMVANDDYEIAENINKETYNDTVNTASAVPRNDPNTSTNDPVKPIHKTCETPIDHNRNINSEMLRTPDMHNVNVIKQPVPPNNEAVNPPLVPNIVPTENDKIVIREFGHSFTVSLLAYHLIQRRRPNEYFCCMCDIWFTANVWHHTMDPVHTARIATVPFLSQTTFHLIRQTKYGFYCVVCSIFIQNNPINHTWDPMHLALLNRVICPDPLPPNEFPSKLGGPVFYQNKATTSVENSKQSSQTKKQINVNKVDNAKDVEFEKKDESNESKVETELTEPNDQNDFNTEEYLYVKIKNVYTKITMTSYNSLLQTGNGTRYCLLCSMEVFFQDLKAHISSAAHLQNLEKCKFLEKYERHMLRQMSTCYHCALCNVYIIKSFLNDHLSWPPHKDTEANKIVKHIRRSEIRSGVKEITCTTQKEKVNTDMKMEFKMLHNIEFRPQAQQDIVKKKKLIILDNVVLKISWDAFHGVSKNKNGYKCLICQTDFKLYELSPHTESSRHMNTLENCFRLEYSPSLIRKINDTTLHCLTCNIEINNEKNCIQDHIDSKRHSKKHTTVVGDKTDCDSVENHDILILKGNELNKKKKRAS